MTIATLLASLAMAFGSTPLRAQSDLTSGVSGHPATIEEAAERVQDMVRVSNFAGIMSLTGAELTIYHYRNDDAVEPPYIVPASGVLPAAMIERLEMMGHELRSHTPSIVTGAGWGPGDIQIREERFQVRYHALTGGWNCGFDFVNGPNGLVLHTLSYGEQGTTVPPTEVHPDLVAASETVRAMVTAGQFQDLWHLVDPALGLTYGETGEAGAIGFSGPLPAALETDLRALQAAQTISPEGWFLSQGGALTYRFAEIGRECPTTMTFMFVQSTAGMVVRRIWSGEECG